MDHSRQLALRQDAGQTKFGNTRPLRSLLSVALSSPHLASSSLMFQKKICMGDMKANSSFKYMHINI